MVPFHMLGMVSHYYAKVTLSLRRTIFQISHFKARCGYRGGKNRPPPFPGCRTRLL